MMKLAGNADRWQLLKSEVRTNKASYWINISTIVEEVANRVEAILSLETLSTADKEKLIKAEVKKMLLEYRDFDCKTIINLLEKFWYYKNQIELLKQAVGLE